MRRYADNAQRFLTFLIDMIIVSAIISGVSLIVYKYLNFDINTKYDIWEKIRLEMNNVVQTGDMTNYLYYYTELLKYLFVELVVTTIVTFVGVLLYFVILPCIWKKQTFGRWIAQTKVVMEDGSKMTLKAILIRELVGNHFFYFYFGIIGYVISLANLNRDNKTIVDKISKTILIHSVQVVNVKDDEKEENPDENQVDSEVVKPKEKNIEDDYIVF